MPEYPCHNIKTGRLLDEPEKVSSHHHLDLQLARADLLLHALHQVAPLWLLYFLTSASSPAVGCTDYYSVAQSSQ